MSLYRAEWEIYSSKITGVLDGQNVRADGVDEEELDDGQGAVYAGAGGAACGYF